MAIKAFIIDFGGVLVRTRDYSGRDRWETQLGIPKGELSRAVFDSKQAVLATVGKASEEAIWQNVGDSYKLTPEQLAELRVDFWRGDRLDDKLVDFIESLRPRLKTAVLSNAWPEARQTFFRVYHLGQYFDHIFISAEMGVAKPDPAIFRVTLDRLGVTAVEAIFIDDALENVLAAEQLGLKAIHFTGTKAVIRETLELLGPSLQ
ncbi:MAG: HAD family phosphatase [Chloroflexi bacterium]|nr:HAD family phosphatase [Chloroflexota bacterium]